MAESTGKIQRDHLTRTELIICALIAVGLHILLVLLFSKEHNQAIDPGMQNRSNILFAETDPNFATVTQRINSEPDPAEFIRGGDTGYSSCRNFELTREPESKNNIPALAVADNSQVQPESLNVERSYADLLTYSAPIPGPAADTAKNAEAAKTTYPLWKDAFGVIRNIKTSYNGYNTTISINSNTVTAPTILQIRFNEGKQKDLPAYILVKQSCGDGILDQYAKGILQNHISDSEKLKQFNQKYNDLVYIYWQPELNAVDESAIPKNMLPEGSGI